MTLVRFEHPLDLPEEYYAPLGRVAAQWALTELYVQAVVWHFLGIADPKIGRTLTYSLNPIDKLKLFNSLPLRWVTDNQLVSEIQRLHADAESLRATRNKLIHGLWGHPPGEPDELRLFFIKSEGQKIIPDSLPFPPAKIDAEAKKIRQLNERLLALIQRIGAPLP